MLAEGVSNPAEIDAIWAYAMKTEKLPCRMMDWAGLDRVGEREEYYVQNRGLDRKHLDLLGNEYLSKGKSGSSSDKRGLYPPRTN